MNEWTAAELAILREHAGKKCAREIAAIVGRPRFATLQKLRKLHLPGFAPGRMCTWTPAQLEALRNVASGVSSLQFARQHGLSDESVRHWARRLGLKLTPASRWTAEQEQQVRDLAPMHTAKQIAALVGRTMKAVNGKALALGVVPVRDVRGGWGSTRPRRVKAAPAAKPSRPPAAQKQPRVKPQRPASAPRKPTPIRRPEPSRIEWCQACYAPVSNWQEHYERMGHRRPAA